MYISPDRDASPPRPRRGRLALGVAGGVSGLAVFLVLRPDLARLQAARLFPSPTPSPTATPSASELAAAAATATAMAMGDSARAADMLATAVRVEPEGVDARLALAQLQLRQRRFQAAGPPGGGAGAEKV